mmetsp:Transcript_14084/g.60305  ORF Transcript_14084/g.60305 Transcript_14084/m.60305 type:complete len:239 (+) Transcript_14084:2340-3056(+)
MPHFSRICSMKSSRPSCPVRTLHRKLMLLNLTMMSPLTSPILVEESFAAGEPSTEDRRDNAARRRRSCAAVALESVGSGLGRNDDVPGVDDAEDEPPCEPPLTEEILPPRPVAVGGIAAPSASTDPSESPSSNPEASAASSSCSSTSLNSAARQFGSSAWQNLQRFSSDLPEHWSCHRAMHRACTQRGHRHGLSRFCFASSKQIQHTSSSPGSATRASDLVRRGSEPDTMAPNRLACV